MTDLFPANTPLSIQLHWKRVEGGLQAELRCNNSGWRLETHKGPQGYFCYVRRYANRNTYEANDQAQYLWILGPYSELEKCQRDAEYYVGLRRNRIHLKAQGVSVPKVSCPVTPEQIAQWRNDPRYEGTLGKVQSCRG